MSRINPIRFIKMEKTLKLCMDDLEKKNTLIKKLREQLDDKDEGDLIFVGTPPPQREMDIGSQFIEDIDEDEQVSERFGREAAEEKVEELELKLNELIDKGMLSKKLTEVFEDMVEKNEIDSKLSSALKDVGEPYKFNPVLEFILKNKNRKKIERSILKRSKKLTGDEIINGNIAESFIRNYITEKFIPILMKHDLINPDMKELIKQDNLRRKRKVKVNKDTLGDNGIDNPIEFGYNISSITRPYEKTGYEDVSLYYGKDGTDEKYDHLELLIDVKYSGKGSSGNLVSNKVARKKYDKPLLYFILIHEKNVITDVKIYMIQELKFDIIRVASTGQYTKSQIREKKGNRVSIKILIQTLIDNEISIPELDMTKKNNRERIYKLAIDEGIEVNTPKTIFLVDSMKKMITPKQHLINLLISFRVSFSRLLTNRITDFEVFVESVKDISGLN